MSDIQDKIRSRGHWVVAIHPTISEVREENLGQLESIVRTLSVQLRGWDFPHVDTKKPIVRGLDWVGQEYQWAHHVGSWRLHSNGLFLSTEGLPIDWRDESEWWPAAKDWRPNELLGVGDALFSVTEFLEFASRLATSSLGDSEMEISVTLKGAEDRLLYVDSPGRASFHHEYRSGIDEIPVHQNVERTRLVGEAWTTAAELSRRIFSVFGWDADVAILLDHQKELRRAASS